MEKLKRYTIRGLDVHGSGDMIHLVEDEIRNLMKAYDIAKDEEVAIEVLEKDIANCIKYEKELLKLLVHDPDNIKKITEYLGYISNLIRELRALETRLAGGEGTLQKRINSFATEVDTTIKAAKKHIAQKEVDAAQKKVSGM